MRLYFQSLFPENGDFQAFVGNSLNRVTRSADDDYIDYDYNPGKRSSNHLLRFARRLSDNEDIFAKRGGDDHLLRFAKRAGDDHLLRFARSDPIHLLRFARANNHLLRFARSDDHLLRFARGDDHLLRFAKRAGDDHYLRFAKDTDDHFLRFAKSGDDHFLRFAKGEKLCKCI